MTKESFYEDCAEKRGLSYAGNSQTSWVEPCTRVGESV